MERWKESTFQLYQAVEGSEDLSGSHCPRQILTTTSSTYNIVLARCDCSGFRGCSTSPSDHSHAPSPVAPVTARTAHASMSGWKDTPAQTGTLAKGLCSPLKSS